MKQILDTVEKKMNKVLDNLDANLRTIRTGRANANMLERVSVEYYGSPTPINQISSIQVVEGRQLVVKPYDRSILKEIDHAIGAANLGLVPQNDGDVIRIARGNYLGNLDRGWIEIKGKRRAVSCRWATRPTKPRALSAGKWPASSSYATACS